MEILDQAIEAIDTLTPMVAGAVTALLSRTLDLAQSGTLEPFKTDNLFDAAAMNPDWLGGPAA